MPGQGSGASRQYRFAVLLVMFSVVAAPIMPFVAISNGAAAQSPDGTVLSTATATNTTHNGTTTNSTLNESSNTTNTSTNTTTNITRNEPSNTTNTSANTTANATLNESSNTTNTSANTTNTTLNTSTNTTGIALNAGANATNTTLNESSNTTNTSTALTSESGAGNVSTTGIITSPLSQGVSVKPDPDGTTLLPGGAYTIDVTTGVERGGIMKEDTVSDPYLTVTVLSNGTGNITGVASRDADYATVQRDISTRSVTVQRDSFSAGSLSRALFRVAVPEDASEFALRVEVGSGDGAPDATVTRNYTVTTDRTSWEALAARAEERQRVATKLSERYNATVDYRSVENITERGVTQTFLTVGKFTASLAAGSALSAVSKVGGALTAKVAGALAMRDDLNTAKSYAQYVNRLQDPENFSDPWMGPASRAQMRMAENGFTTVEMNRVETAGNSSYILSRIDELAAAEATAWRNHNRERALEKLRRQREYLTATDSYGSIDDLQTPDTFGENIDNDGEHIYQTDAKLGREFNLFRTALNQKTEAENGARMWLSNEAAFENAALYFEGVRTFAADTAENIATTTATTRRPTPRVTLTNRAQVRTQLSSSGTVQATFEVANDGGPTSVRGYLTLTYSDETLAVTDIEQVEEEHDGAVLRNTTYNPDNESGYVNDTLTNTYEAGDVQVLTRGGDRAYVNRTVTDVFERFGAGETNTYRVTFERTGASDERAVIGYRTAFQPLVHEDGNSTFVRDPTLDDATAGVQGWAVRTVNASASTAAAFDTEVTSTNSPVRAGESIDVTGRIENTGSEAATTNVVLSVAGVGSSAQSVQLDAGASATRTFSVSTGAGDVGEHAAELVTPSNSSTTTVRVEPTQPDLAGEGTAANPYVVTDATELQAIENDLDAQYVLGNDIDASNTSAWNGGSGFDPIGPDTRFSGTLDGNGHTITALTIDRGGDQIGLFSKIGGSGVVEDLTLRNAEVHAEGHMGVLAGTSSGTVRRVSATGSVSGAYDRGGGLIGVNQGAITESTASVSVAAGDILGGLVGVNYGTVSESYATGSVSGYYDLGGLVGGNAGNITESYTTASVSSNGDSGGFAGFNDEGNVTDAYWSVNATGMGGSEAGSPLTTAELRGDAAVGNLSGFDFGTTWQVRATDSPALAWQDVATNAAPVPTADRYETVAGTALTVSEPGVLGNDTDEDGDSLSVAATVTAPANGTLSLAANGSFRYIPDPGFAGRDSFTYRVSDGAGGSNTAVVAIEVRPGVRRVDGEADGDDDYATIGAALAATDGGRVVVEPGTYAERLTLEENVTLLAPDGATLDGSGFDGSAALTVPTGTHAAPIVSGFSVENYTTGLAAGGAQETGSAGTEGPWTLRNVTIVGSERFAVDASGTAGNWTLDGVRIEDGAGVAATESTGAWAVRDTTIATGDIYGVDARRSEGDWTIRNASIEGTTALGADQSAGNWRVLGSQLYSGVYAEQSTGEWTVRYTLVVDGGVDARDTDGNWRVRSSVIRNAYDGVSAGEAAGSWSVTGSAFVNIGRDDINATAAPTEGDATGNWWGANGESCAGNVTCSDALSEPPSILPDNEPPRLRVDGPDRRIAREEPFTLSAANSTDPDGRIRSLEWDTDDDGHYERSGETVTVSYWPAENHTIGLRATDDAGGIATTTTTVRVRPAANLMLRSFDVNRTTTLVGDPISINATVENTGANESAFDIYAAYGEHYDYRPGLTRTLAPGETTRVTIPYASEDTGTRRVGLYWRENYNTEFVWPDPEVTVDVQAEPDLVVSRSPGRVVTDDTVTVSLANSTDRDGGIATYEWDLDGDGTFEATGVSRSWTPTDPGVDRYRVRAVDTDGNAVTRERAIAVRRPDDWPGRGVGPGRTNANPAADGPVRGIERAWSADTGNVLAENRVAPAVVDGVVYANTEDGVTAFDATSGSVEWTANVSGAPRVWGETVLVESDELIALDRTSGDVRWRGPEPGDNAVVRGGVAYTSDGHAVDVQTGDVLWEAPLANGYSGVAVGPRHVYLSSYYGPVTAIHASNGSVAWRLQDVQGVAAPPALANGTLFVGQENATAINAATGEIRWRTHLGNQTVLEGTPAVSGDTVYYSTKNDTAGIGGYLYALNRTSGAVEWTSAPYPDWGQSAPVVAGDTVYVATNDCEAAESCEGITYPDGRVQAHDATTGDRLWNESTEESLYAGPAVWNGTVYIKNGAGKLLALAGNTSGPVAAATANRTTVTAGETASLTAEPARGSVSYDWRIAAGNGTLTGDGPTVTYVAPADNSKTGTVDIELFADGVLADTLRLNVIPEKTLRTNASLVTTVNNVGAPLRINANATVVPNGQLTRLRVTANGSELSLATRVACGDDASCTERLSVTPENSTWSDGDYDRVPLRVTAVTETGRRTTETVDTAVYVPGDATGDGSVDIFDAVTVGKHWDSARDTPAYADAGDLNNDGSVDIFDAAILGQNWEDTADAGS